MTAPVFAPRTSRSPLARVFWLRNFMLAGLLLLMLWSELYIGVQLPWVAMSATLLLLAALNAFTALRLRQAAPIRPPEILMQLLADLAGLTVLLLHTGGWANPFVSLLLLPVVMAALLLPAPMAWLAGFLSIAAYSLVAYINIPLNIPPEKAFYLHVSGMWLTFAVSVAVVVFMVLKLRTLLADRERELAAFREETLRNEQLVAVALTASGAAHELGTPLNTLAVLSESLLADADEKNREDLELMRSQIERCRLLLKDLSRTAQAAAVGEPLAADRYLQQLAEEWRLLRPAAQVTVAWQSDKAPQIQPPASLGQALINLLNNAADAAPGSVCIEGSLADEGWRIDILDAGPGPAPALRALAEPGISAKGGLGLGLFLSNASIENLGGHVVLSEREGGGTCVSVWLPLSGLQK
ncbi:MAG: ATP-binding protein [Pseudomonadota bacterium]